MRSSKSTLLAVFITPGILGVLGLQSRGALAQAPPPTVQKEAMAKIAYWIGTWKGTSTTILGPGKQRESEVAETITSKVDGLVLQIDGIGKSRGADGKEAVTHNALGIVWYDAEQKQYRFKSFVMQGFTIETEMKPVGDGFQWGFKAGSALTIRYTISNRDNHWKEVGESSTDGANWHKMFEMNLEKHKP